jgi:hypothetical protein
MVERGYADDVLRLIRPVLDAQLRRFSDVARPLLDLRRAERTQFDQLASSLQAIGTSTHPALAPARAVLARGPGNPTAAILRLLWRDSKISETMKDRLGRVLVGIWVRRDWVQESRVNVAARLRVIRQEADKLDEPRPRIAIHGREYLKGQKNKRVTMLSPADQERWWWPHVEAVLRGDAWTPRVRTWTHEIPSPSAPCVQPRRKTPLALPRAKRLAAETPRSRRQSKPR